MVCLEIKLIIDISHLYETPAISFPALQLAQAARRTVLHCFQNDGLRTRGIQTQGQDNASGWHTEVPHLPRLHFGTAFEECL